MDLTGESTRYDQVAYPARAFAQTHPNRLATLARLSGLDPAPPENCRVSASGATELEAVLGRMAKSGLLLA